MNSKKPKAIFLLPSLLNCSPINGVINIALCVSDLLECYIVGVDKNISHKITKKLNTYNLKWLSLNCTGWFNIFIAKKNLEKLLKQENIKILFSSLLRPDLISHLISKKDLLRISIPRDLIDIQYRNDYNYLCAWIFGRLHFNILKKMDYVVTMSDAMRNYFIKKGIHENKMLMLYNFLDENEILKNKSSIVQKPNNHNVFTFITASRLIKRKNILSLLKAFLNLKLQGYSNFKFYIFGNGEQQSTLDNFIKRNALTDNVFLNDFVENIIPFLQKADFYLSASKSEGVPRSVMEALYVGVPCILSNIDGHRELINDNQNGFIFENEEELLTILKSILENKIILAKHSTSNLLPIKFSAKHNQLLLRNFILNNIMPLDIVSN